MPLSDLKIAIIGCGPGGLSTALFLTRIGHDVTLFERFSEPKPVGSGLLIQPSGQQVLDRLDLLNSAVELAAPVHQLHGISVRKNRRALDMQYSFARTQVPALGIHRASLFDVLMDAVSAAGILVVGNHRLTCIQESGNGITPVFADSNSEQEFDLLIDASGARSPLAMGRIIELPYGAMWSTIDMPVDAKIMPNALDQRYYQANEMAGIMPIGVNPATGNQGAAIFWSEKPQNAPDIMDAGAEKLREKYCSLWAEAEPFVEQIKSMDEWTMAVYSHRTGKSQSSDRLLHVGDSWHCTSPQLGQGANMALMDANALACAFQTAEHVRDVGRHYRQIRSFHIWLYQTLSRVFTPLYQSDNRMLPWIRDLTIHHFARWPLIRALIAETVSGVLGSGRSDTSAP